MPDEAAFRRWYKQMAQQYDLNPNPDVQPYDYRGAFAAQASPDESGHWPSQFKVGGHPNEVVGGFNTRTGARMQGSPRLTAPQLEELGWAGGSANKLAQTGTDKADALGGNPAMMVRLLKAILGGR